MKRVNSPCVKVCCLDDKDICIGCKRSLDEILAWSAASDDERLKILKHCEQRRLAHSASNKLNFDS